MPNGHFYSYEQASQRIEQFERLLNQHGIKIQNGSDLERICLNVFDMLERHQRPELPNPLDEFRTYYSEVLGLNDFIIKILRVEKHPCFKNLIPHFRLLNMASVPQNLPAIVTDGNSNKLFELFIAAICMSFSYDVSLDNPENSKGDNPDVIFSFCNQQWGIACKVIHTTSIKTIHERLLEGIDQIQNSPSVKKGFVLINLKNIIDHDRLWPITNKEAFLQGAEPSFGSFRDTLIPMSMLYEYGNNISLELVKEYGIEYNINMYKEKKSLPGFLQFIQSATSVSFGASPYPTTLGIFNWVKSSVNNFSECEMQCMQLLNYSMHNN
jgi:hypothetical protein